MTSSVILVGSGAFGMSGEVGADTSSCAAHTGDAAGMWSTQDTAFLLHVQADLQAQAADHHRSHTSCQAQADLELLKGQVRDDPGVSATVLAIRVVREQRLLHSAHVHAIRGGVDPLHLVEDHTFEGHLILQAG